MIYRKMVLLPLPFAIFSRRGEGWGEGPPQAPGATPPLTLTLSPCRRGRGNKALTEQLSTALRPFALHTALLLATLGLCGPALAGEAAADHIRGLVVPLHHARLSSRLQATIDRIGPETGEAFKAGDILVEFDCAAFQAERERARAEAEGAVATLAVKKELASSGNSSRLQAVLAEADVKKTRAAVDVANKQVEGCRIAAPYDGRVVERLANAHETVGFRDPLIEIVADRELELRVYVPSRALRSIGKGSPLELDVDETGERMPARVIALGARIDNVSQLIEIRAGFSGGTERLLPGMSGNVSFLTGLASAP